MTNPLRTAFGLLALASAVAGCAALAKKTPTPADELSDRQWADAPPPAGERYYLIVFGSQDLPKRPKYTHTWATVVRAVCRDGDPEPTLDCHTISWLPATGDIRPLNFRVEPGRNYDLRETMDVVTRTGQRASVWGPYEVWHGFLPRFLVQKGFLESGQVGYQCVDTVGEAARTGGGCDCIHAVADMDPAYSRARYPLVFYGNSASYYLVRRFMRSPVVIDPRTTHDWVLGRLGLDEYRLERKRYCGLSKPYVPGGPAGLEAAPALPVPVPVRPSAQGGGSATGSETPRGQGVTPGRAAD
jgi:hypothetical protein